MNATRDCRNRTSITIHDRDRTLAYLKPKGEGMLICFTHKLQTWARYVEALGPLAPWVLDSFLIKQGPHRMAECAFLNIEKHLNGFLTLSTGVGSPRGVGRCWGCGPVWRCLAADPGAKTMKMVRPGCWDNPIAGHPLSPKRYPLALSKTGKHSAPTRGALVRRRGPRRGVYC